MTRPRHPDREFLIFAMILCVLVWIYLLTSSVRMEERATVARGFVLDNNGEVVQTYGHVWELGKGTRPATAEEKSFEGERE